MATKAEIIENLRAAQIPRAELQAYAQILNVIATGDADQAIAPDMTDEQLIERIADSFSPALTNIETYVNTLENQLPQENQNFIPTATDGLWDANTALNIMTMAETLNGIEQMLNTRAQEEAAGQANFLSLENLPVFQTITNGYSSMDILTFMDIADRTNATDYQKQHVQRAIHVSTTPIRDWLNTHREAINLFYNEDRLQPLPSGDISPTDPVFLQTITDAQTALQTVSETNNLIRMSLNASGFSQAMRSLDPRAVQMMQTAEAVYAVTGTQTPLSSDIEIFEQQFQTFGHKQFVNSLAETISEIEPFDITNEPFNMDEQGFQTTYGQVLTYLRANPGEVISMPSPITGQNMELQASELLTELAAADSQIRGPEQSQAPAPNTTEEELDEDGNGGVTEESETPSQEGPDPGLVKALEDVFAARIPTLSPDTIYDSATMDIVSTDLRETMQPLLESGRFGADDPIEINGTSFHLALKTNEDGTPDIIIMQGETETARFTDPVNPHPATIRILGDVIAMQNDRLSALKVANQPLENANAQTSINAAREDLLANNTLGIGAADIEAVQDTLKEALENRNALSQSEFENLAAVRALKEKSGTDNDVNVLMLLLLDNHNFAVNTIEINTLSQDLRENNRILELFGAMAENASYDPGYRQRIADSMPYYDDILFSARGYDRINSLLEGNSRAMADLFDGRTQQQYAEMQAYFRDPETGRVPQYVSRDEILEYANARFALYALDVLSDGEVLVETDNFNRDYIQNTFLKDPKNQRILSTVSQAMTEGRFVPFDEDVRLALLGASPNPRLSDQTLQTQIMNLSQNASFNVPGAFILNNNNPDEVDAIRNTAIAILEDPTSFARQGEAIERAMIQIGASDQIKTHIIDYSQQAADLLAAGQYEAARDLLHGFDSPARHALPTADQKALLLSRTTSLLIQKSDTHFNGITKEAAIGLLFNGDAQLRGALTDSQKSVIFDRMFEAIDFENIPASVGAQFNAPNPVGAFETVTMAYYGQWLHNFEYHKRDDFNTIYSSPDSAFRNGGQGGVTIVNTLLDAQNRRYNGPMREEYIQARTDIETDREIARRQREAEQQEQEQQKQQEQKQKDPADTGQEVPDNQPRRGKMVASNPNNRPIIVAEDFDTAGNPLLPSGQPVGTGTVLRENMDDVTAAQTSPESKSKTPTPGTGPGSN